MLGIRGWTFFIPNVAGRSFFTPPWQINLLKMEMYHCCASRWEPKNFSGAPRLLSILDWGNRFRVEPFPMTGLGQFQDSSERSQELVSHPVQDELMVDVSN